MFEPPRGIRVCHMLWLFVVVAPAYAHPAHETNAEMVWNAKTRSLEVALQLRGIDLEAALTKKRSRKVDLDATRDVDARIQEYIASAFTVRLQAGQSVRPKYVGKNIEARRVWLYFEFPIGHGNPVWSYHYKSISLWNA